MKVKSYKNLILFIFGFAAITAIYFAFYLSPWFDAFTEWVQDYQLYFFLTLVLIKFAGIVWPPFPGGVLTVGSIPVLGWELAFLADYLGGLTGGTAAFLISRKFGKEFLTKIFDEESISRMENLPIKSNRQFEMLFIIMTFGGSTIIELVAYGAGIVKEIGFWPFLIARATAHPLVGIPLFYLIGNVFSGDKIIINLLLLLVLLPLLWVLRHRYIDL
jgi:uncharacterized membrane protein YdjX (TVP38/TMEM64 family)